MNHLKTLFMVAAILYACNANAQLIESLAAEEMNYRISVKQVEEFMKRFNLEQTNELFEAENDSLKRRVLNMTGLLNFELIKSRSDEVREFVMAMLDNKVKLAFTDTTWNAVATCEAIYQGKPTRIVLLLGTEHIKETMYKWVIKDATGDILKLKPQKSNPGLKIMPTDNEVNFMSLGHITTVEAKNILNYKAKNSEVNELSVFLALVSQGLLKIQHVTELEYQFHVPHLYDFTVKQFRREALNSGWLISDFNKIDENE